MKKDKLIPIGVRIPEPIWVRVRKEAEKKNWGMSDIVREALEKRYKK